MMALIIISPLLKHLEAFSSFPPLTAIPVRPSQKQLVPCHCGSIRTEKQRAALHNASQDLNDLLGFFHFYGIFVFIVEDSREGMGLDLFETGWI